MTIEFVLCLRKLYFFLKFLAYLLHFDHKILSVKARR